MPGIAGAQPPSFAVLFASAAFRLLGPALVAAVAEGDRRRAADRVRGAGGGGRRPRGRVGPAVSLWLAADLGPVETFAMEFVRDRERRRVRRLPVHAGCAGVHLMVCDPFTFPAGDLLAHLNQHVPGPW
jgi:small ligand-binding sensory domain FIST